MALFIIGTVITAEHRRFFKEARVPVVVVGQYTKYANCIYHDDYGAGKAMGHAVALRSRERIGYIGVTREDKSAGAAREDGFMAGMKAAGREPESVYRRTAKFTTESGYEESVKLLKEKHDIDIISCATDTIAAGAIQAVKSVCPDKEILVTGFGDNQLLKAVTGGIPTVHFGYMTSGIRGAELLLDRIEQDENVSVEMKLGFRLIGLDELPDDKE